MLNLPARRKKEQPGSRGVRRFFAPLTGRAWLTIGTAILLSLCLATNLQLQRYSLRVGEVIPRDIRVPQAPPAGAPTVAPPAPSITENRQAPIDALDELAAATRRLQLARAQTSTISSRLRSLQAALPRTPEPLLMACLTAPPSVFEAASHAAPVLLTLEMAQRPISSRVGDLELSRNDLVYRARSLALPPKAAALAAALAGPFLRPTLIEEAPAAPVRRSAFFAPASLHLAQSGQLLARKGQSASPQLIQQLRDLGLLNSQFGPLWRLCLVALAVGSMAVVILFIRLYYPLIYADTRRLALLSFIVLTGVAALRFLGYALGLHLSPAQFGFFALMWVAAVAMLISVLIGAEIAVLVSALLSMHTAILLDSQLQFGIACLFSALAGVFSVRRLRHRSQVLLSMGVLAAVNLASSWVLTIWNTGTAAPELKVDLGVATVWALASGVMSPILFFVGVAVLERLFHVTTDLSLLELCDNHQPLLRRLVLEAPGTYAHSVGVASLAEAAAEAIGAEVLWTRAGALYHDVGKIVRPYFFIENQQGENLHNKLSPTMSGKIITAHITDGVELAKEYRLPELLIDFIRQHHGTSLVTYFYHQAIISSGVPSGISEDSFRYAGPKPQSREAGILMLADSVESTLRSASRRNPGRVDAIVARVVQSRLTDGQLSECDLTLREIDQIQGAFTRVLTAMHHTRVEYPASESTEERMVAIAGSGR